MTTRARNAILSLFVSAAAVACALGGQSSSKSADASPGSNSDETIPVTIDTDRGPVAFKAEIADTPATRQKGLMYRSSLPESGGMLFLFPSEGPRSFWMKNTLIPLDMIFIRADKTILGIVENAEPETLTGRSVPGSSQYVLELIGGSAARYRLAAGQNVRFYAPVPSR